MTEHDIRSQWPRELSLDEDAGPAGFIARTKIDGMIANALDQAGFVASAKGIAHAPDGALRQQTGRYVAGSARPASRWGARSLAAAVLVACVGAGSASAAVMWFGRTERPLPVSAPSVAAKAHVRKASARPEPTTEQPIEAALPAPAALVEAEPAAHKASARAPEDWLVEGNRLRIEQRWGRADAAYARAAQHAPHSQTAYVARVASVAVRLEHLGDARGALALYRAALHQAPRGALSEEIHWGIAEAYRALHDVPAERAALERFVREHPSSPLVKQAQARLD